MSNVSEVPGVPRATVPNKPVAAPAAAAAPTATGSATTVSKQQAIRLDVNDLLRYVVEVGGSDLHLTVGAKPTMRLHGEMTPIPGYPPLTDGALQPALMTLLSEQQEKLFKDTNELDLAYDLPGVSRFRGNMLRQQQHVAAVFRVIPSEIMPLESLGLPPMLYSFASLARGLILVTGPTGSGKSTTLASLIDRVNRTRAGHIVTIEDPIEFIHRHRASIVNQREVGSDTHSFASALRHVLRQDPDVILIGELRDLETISTAITAAETGHLVFATLHTQSAADTVSRIIDVFPEGQQQQIRSQLAATLKGVVTQALVRRHDGAGRVPAVEIMVVTPAIAAMIRRDELHQIGQAIQSGGGLGMQTLNTSLADLVARGVVDRESAEEYATDIKDFDALLTGRQQGGRNVNRPVDRAAMNSFGSSSL